MSGSAGPNFALLKAPFPVADVEWRVGQAGAKNDGEVWCQVLAYLTSRAVMDRLDDVAGPTGWSTKYRELLAADGGTMGIECTLTVLGVAKADIGTVSDIEPLKGAYSDALKRAAVQWGIGRYLYSIGTSWAIVSPSGKNRGSFKDKKTGEYRHFKWDPPALPDWARGAQ
jgi:hypothetical protein